tara:strand:- start:44 stop:349 length:306 start_codon:yes stop_codon:yes gene_type:complete
MRWLVFFIATLLYGCSEDKVRFNCNDLLEIIVNPTTNAAVFTVDNETFFPLETIMISDDEIYFDRKRGSDSYRYNIKEKKLVQSVSISFMGVSNLECERIR